MLFSPPRAFQAHQYIKYASANYQVQEVCGFLRALGVSIEGIGSTTLTIHGVADINKDISYSVAEDPTDAMFFIAAAIVTGSRSRLRPRRLNFLKLNSCFLKKWG